MNVLPGPLLNFLTENGIEIEAVNRKDVVVCHKPLPSPSVSPFRGVLFPPQFRKCV